jgi:hypothetical protein
VAYPEPLELTEREMTGPVDSTLSVTDTRDICGSGSSNSEFFTDSSMLSTMVTVAMPNTNMKTVPTTIAPTLDPDNQIPP